VTYFYSQIFHLIRTTTYKDIKLSNSKKNQYVLGLSELEKINDILHSSKKEKDILEHLNLLLDHSTILNFQVNGDPIRYLYRVVKSHEDGFSELSRIIQPPRDKCTLQRLNKESEPILYLSNHMYSAFDEIDVKEGDYIQVLRYELTSEDSPRLAVFGENQHIWKWRTAKFTSEEYKKIFLKKLNFLINKEKIEEHKSLIYADSILSSLLKSKSNSSNLYHVTSHIPEILFNKIPDLDGIAYEGVSSNGAYNIALKTTSSQKYLVPKNCYLIRIKKCFGYSIYDEEFVKYSKEISFDGLIHWE
jgi:hypothetical protein